MKRLMEWLFRRYASRLPAWVQVEVRVWLDTPAVRGVWSDVVATAAYARQLPWRPQTHWRLRYRVRYGGMRAGQVVSRWKSRRTRTRLIRAQR